MGSREYWRKREEEQRKKNIQNEKEYQKRVNEIYDRMLDEITKEINGFYVKYAKKEGITMAEAKKRVSQLDIDEYAKKAKIYVKNKDFSDEANEEMRIYNLTMKVNRLEMLKANIGMHMVDGFNEIEKVAGEALTDKAYEELKRQAGILGDSVQDNAKFVDALVNASYQNATYSERVWMYQGMLKSEIDKLLQTGLIQGKNPRVLARHLEKHFGASRYNANRLMITEMARVQTEVQKQSYIRNGFEEYEYIGCNKGDACKKCRALDGKPFKVEDMMPGENAPPMHPQCHCSTAAYIDEEEYYKWLDSYKEHGLSFEEWDRLRAFAEKEESKQKYKYKDTVVNTSEISSSEYRRKFTNITGENKISRALWENALDMLDHRSGTKYEDLAFVNSKTGDTKINKNYDKENTASPSKSMRKMLRDADANTIIAIHNHPGSSAPSYSDIMACKDRKYKYGLVVCHDGMIYKYSVDGERLNIPMAVSALDRVAKRGYTKTTSKECAAAGIRMEVF